MNIEFLPDPAVLTDREGVILAVNSLARELGFSEGRRIYEFLDTTPEIEVKGRIYGVKMSESENHRIYILRDITERKEIEEKLKESEQMYRTLVELSPDAIVVHDGQKILFVNKRAAELSGFEKPEDMIGLPILDFVHPDYVDFVKKRVARMMVSRVASTPAEEKFVLPDGSTRDVEVNASFISFDGKPAILLIVRDISERKKLEEAREKAIWQINRNIEQFAILVDKIRNPLAVIAGTVEVRCDNDDVRRKVFEAVNKIESIITEVEKVWLESEDVRKLLRGIENENTSG